MNILFISAEVMPYAKVGGLADVAGSLPAALAREGHDVRVLMPGYGLISHSKYNIVHKFSFDFDHRAGTTKVHVYMCVQDDVTYYFIQAWPYFGQEDKVYLGWERDVPRFLFFNQLVMAFSWQLSLHDNWFPNILHVHDWHSSLVPFLVADGRWQREWAKVGTVTTIHNIAYQGNGVGGYTWMNGIPGRNHPLLVERGLGDNMLAMAIAYSDVVTTVSPTYAQEIQYPYAGYELAGLIRARSNDLFGILNGIDTELWNPDTDSQVRVNFNADNFEEKRIHNKRHLQAHAQLPVRDDVPVIGVVSRLTWQKGFDLGLPAIWQLLQEGRDIQFIGLGTGESELESQLYQLQQAFPNKVRALLKYDAAFSQEIYAGSDLFLMPSHFEPCGIGQMLAMRYGALPVVRKTGGLADTVQNYDNGNGDNGTGFVFEWEEVGAVTGTLRWALDVYYNRRSVWQRLQQRAMGQDFSWGKSAREYLDLYRLALSRHA